MLDQLPKIAEAFLRPIPDEVQANKREAWGKLPEEMRVSRQMYGSHAHNCGGTIGVMPRCDFSCRECYIGEGANVIPPQPVDEIKRQLRVLRRFLGPRGNLQLTDGEVTLRPEGELIELIQYARSVDLLPMLMTHGDTFRRRPGLLERLIEAGLTEVSIHVDTDMRGRKGEAYKRAAREEELNPLRDEFAEILRAAIKKTGRKIASATTMTITSENLEGVPAVMRWLVKNTDVFKLISFQPAAQVGHTEEGLGGSATVEALWEKITEGLYGDDRQKRERLLASTYWMGHKGCNRYVLGSVLYRPELPPHFEPICDFTDPRDEAFFVALRKHFGGVNFRTDTPLESLARVLGCFKDSPKFFLSMFPHVLYRLKRLAPENPYKLLWQLARGEARAGGLNIVSHHFMSREELLTPVGQERLKLCMFRVPIGEEMVSMCETNAAGIRDKYYEEIKSGQRPSVKKRLPVLVQ
jgi:MoaA/NifB/PqqE/SkfB family radical SAM enzyme